MVKNEDLSMVGIGCDIETADRFKSVLNNKKFLSSIFTDGEIRGCKGASRAELYFARKFACKEAVFKALSSLGQAVLLKSIEIRGKGSDDSFAVVSRKGIGEKYKVFVNASNAGNVVMASSVVERCEE